MKNISRLIIIALLFSISTSFAQEVVSFKAKDGLTITANLYKIDSSYPYILLFHQAGYSKGEYKETAVKLLKLKYNVLAVDLRSGGPVNFSPNVTAELAEKEDFPHTYIDARQDIVAAINYAFALNEKQVVIFGSSFSASLCLLEGKTNDKVKAVIAFSPGEYFQPQIILQEELMGYKKKIFVACSESEYKYTKLLLSGVEEKYKTLYAPKEFSGRHGSKALWSDCKANKEYWLNLFLFFKQI
jgi:pimeloyl-ACP methyl ester carboxylesterase